MGKLPLSLFCYLYNIVSPLEALQAAGSISSKSAGQNPFPPTTRLINKTPVVESKLHIIVSLDRFHLLIISRHNGTTKRLNMAFRLKRLNTAAHRSKNKNSSIYNIKYLLGSITRPLTVLSYT